MKRPRAQDDHPGSPEDPKEDWSWKPGSGEGSATALDKLKHVERMKTKWRRLRAGPTKARRDDGPRFAG